MKYSSLLILLSTASALVPQAPQPQQKAGKSKAMLAPITAAAIGWTIAAGIANANSLDFPAINSNTVIVSEFEKLDFSMPSYGSNTAGFGEGARSKAEAVKTGILENDLQAQAMQKAEAARKERLAAKKAELKAMEEENKARNLAKKEENARRMKELFN